VASSICDTSRPGEFPSIPIESELGWSGVTAVSDAYTTITVPNSDVPAGLTARPGGDANTVCHEIMHAYTRAPDAYNSDRQGNCVWGSIVSPGPMDIRLMHVRYPAVGEAPSL
jgi:hypothetical protein